MSSRSGADALDDSAGPATGLNARWLVALPLIAFLVFASVWAGRAAMGDALVVSAQVKFDKWAAEGRAPAPGEWSRALDDLNRAMELRPDNPDALEILGLLQLTRPVPAGDPQAALASFSRAVERRPTRGRSWAGALRARYELGLTQAPFERMLAEAIQLDPWDPWVQSVVADAGLALWDEMGPEGKAATGAAIAAGMRRNPEEILGISSRRGRMAPACSHVQGDKRMAQSPWLKICGLRRGK